MITGHANARVRGVAQVTFTANLRRHVACPAASCPGSTVSAVLGNYFVDFPLVRSYIVDETGAVRRHVVVFVDGKQLLDVVGLSDPVNDASEIYVMQALSGG